jgi:hypothetical protein
MRFLERKIMRRKVSRFVYLAAVAAMVMLGLGKEVEAACGSGRQVIVGQLPDVFFTSGQTTVKKISYTYENLGGKWNDCGIYAQSTMTGVAVINSYGNQGREAYPPEVTGIGPATYIGAVQTWSFQIKVLASAPAGSGAINIYVNNACDVCTPNYVLIGRVNVYVRSPFATSFVTTATSANTISNSTFVDHPFTNGNRNARLLVTPNWNPPGSSGVYDNHPIGVWYDGWRGKWAIFNQDLAAMPIGAAFNVRIEGDNEASAPIQTAASGNTAGSSTYITHAITDFNSWALVLFTPTWNLPGANGVYNNHNTGVFYSWGGVWGGKWAIFNQDGASMAAGASFNTRFIGYPGDGAFVHVAGGDNMPNLSSNYTWINNPLTNGNPNAIILVTPNFNPYGLGGQYVNHPIGVWYDYFNRKWAIFYQDKTPIPAGATFHVLVPVAPI